MGLTIFTIKTPSVLIIKRTKLNSNKLVHSIPHSSRFINKTKSNYKLVKYYQINMNFHG